MNNNKFYIYFFIFFSFIVISACTRVEAKVYYVSFTDGLDSNDGSRLAPWKTITHVNSRVFIPGDSILFKCGDTWRGTQLTVSRSGTKGSPITYSSYGTGPKPRFLGSIQASNWTATSTPNVWRSATNIPIDPWTSMLAQFFFVIGDTVAWGDHKNYDAALTNLIEEYDWTYADHVAYVYSTSNPDLNYTSVEVVQQEYAVLLTSPIENGIYNGRDYINVNGIEMAYLANMGVRDAYPPSNCTDLTVTNCHIHHIGIKDKENAFGIGAWHSNAYYAFNHIHDCGRRGISINLWDAGEVTTMENVIIENNRFHDGWHTTGVDLINFSPVHHAREIYIRNNWFDENEFVNLQAENNTHSNSIFLANQSGIESEASVYNVYIYNNIFTDSHGKAVGIEGVDSIYVFFNTFYGFNNTIDNLQPLLNVTQNSTAKANNVYSVNNLFYNNGDYANNDNLWTMHVWDYMVDNLYFDYNLYYTTDERNCLMGVEGTTRADLYRHNIGDWNNYRTATSLDSHSIFMIDPLFNDPENDDFSIMENSVAVGAGIPISLVKTDYYGNYRDSQHPTIGAVEFGSHPPPPEDPDNGEIEITFAPNPVEGGFVDILLTGSIPFETYFFDFYDFSGRYILRSPLLFGSSNRISLPRLASGIYIVKLYVGSKILAAKSLLVK